jgi:hypothetical protein
MHTFSSSLPIQALRSSGGSSVLGSRQERGSMSVLVREDQDDPDAGEPNSGNQVCPNPVLTASYCLLFEDPVESPCLDVSSRQFYVYLM